MLRYSWMQPMEAAAAHRSRFELDKTIIGNQINSFITKIIEFYHEKKECEGPALRDELKEIAKKVDRLQKLIVYRQIVLLRKEIASKQGKEATRTPPRRSPSKTITPSPPKFSPRKIASKKNLPTATSSRVNETRDEWSGMDVSSIKPVGGLRKENKSLRRRPDLPAALSSSRQLDLNLFSPNKGQQPDMDLTRAPRKTRTSLRRRPDLPAGQLMALSSFRGLDFSHLSPGKSQQPTGTRAQRPNKHFTTPQRRPNAVQGELFVSWILTLVPTKVMRWVRSLK